MLELSTISGYHAHVYFDAATREVAVALRDRLAAKFTVELGRVHDGPVGPHPQPMYQVAFAPDQFGLVVPWLMLNRAGLAILVHPETGDDVGDHAERPLWLGDAKTLDIDFLRKHASLAP